MEPIINVEDPVVRTIGRRRLPADSFQYAMGLQKLGSKLSEQLGLTRLPRGLYRFRTHEEADAWSMKLWTKS